MKISVVLPVLAPTPFLRAMTEFCIKTLRLHADEPFELIVVEASHDHLNPDTRPFSWPSEPTDKRDHFITEHVKIDKYLTFTPKIGVIREFNAGLDVATGDLVVHAGNDVIVPPHWDTELKRPFTLFKDCGVSALSAFEPGAVIGPLKSMDQYVEGMYSPFMAFRKGWRFDEDYRRVYQDSDLVLRHYEQGQRAYRSCRAHVHHLLAMTTDRVDRAEHDRDLIIDEERFYKRWGNSPLMMFGLIRCGLYAYGREHEAFTNSIHRHL